MLYTLTSIYGPIFIIQGVCKLHHYTLGVVRFTPKTIKRTSGMSVQYHLVSETSRTNLTNDGRVLINLE